METEITLIGGRTETFDASVEIKLTQFGVEVLARGDDENVRILFPWAQVERMTQHGAAVSAVYTY